jgi:hypothetical protein
MGHSSATWKGVVRGEMDGQKIKRFLRMPNRQDHAAIWSKDFDTFSTGEASVVPRCIRCEDGLAVKAFKSARTIVCGPATFSRDYVKPI